MNEALLVLSEFFDSFLDELEARTAIEDCLKRFARAVDRQNWALARTLYHDDAYDDHGFFKGPPDAFLAHIAQMHTHQDHSMHFNTNVLIEFQAQDRAFVETYVLVLQRFADWTAPLYLAGMLFLLGGVCWIWIDPTKPVSD